MILSHDGLERIQARIGQKAGNHGLSMYCGIKVEHANTMIWYIILELSHSF